MRRCARSCCSPSFFFHPCRVRFSSSPFSLFSQSQAALLRMHRVKGKSNDRGLLEQSDLEMIFLFVFFSCLVSCPAPPPLTPTHLVFICLSLFLSPSHPSDPNAVGQHGTDHALIGGVVAVVVFVTLCLIIVLGRYLARHKGKKNKNTKTKVTYKGRSLSGESSGSMSKLHGIPKVRETKYLRLSSRSFCWDSLSNF